MKTQEQNTKEVMGYLERSARNFFESEDGQHWQSVVRVGDSGKYIFIKDGVISEFDMGYYLGEGKTAGKCFLKTRLHPRFDLAPHLWSLYKGYGHGPKAKLKAVRWNSYRRGLVEGCVLDYLAAQKEKGSL